MKPSPKFLFSPARCAAFSFPLLVMIATLPFVSRAAETSYPSASEKTPSPGGTTYKVDPASAADTAGVFGDFAAINRLKLAPGDTVVVAPGTHKDSLIISGEGTATKPVVVRFLPGKHLFAHGALFTEKLHISNTNDRPNGPKAVGILLAGAKNIRLEGAPGAEIVAEGKMLYFHLDHCENVAVEGLTFDYLHPTMGEFTVVKSGEGFTEVKVNPDNLYRIESGRMYWRGAGWEFPVGGYVRTYDPKTSRFGFGLRGEGLTFEEISPGKVRLKYAKGNSGLAPGLVVQNRDVTRDCCGFFQAYSKNIAWKNCAIRYIHGMGVVSQYTENLTFDKVRAEPAKGSDRTIVAWADVLHFSGCSGAIEVRDCVLGYSHDDSINVHGTHLRIAERPAPDRLVMRFMHGQSYGFEAYFPGDTVDFIHADTLLPFGTGKVKSARRIDDKNIEVTLESPAPEGIRPEDVLENATRTPSLHVANTTVRAESTRAFLITTRKPVLIEKCRFERTAAPAIWVEGDASSWFESGFVRDLTIKGNTFVECAEPVIGISPHVQKAGGAVHTGIRVENNRFELTGGTAVRSTNSEVKASGNTVLKKGATIPENKAMNIR